MNNLDIVELIEKNPITRLSKNYQNVLLNKIKENFNEEEQRLFVTNFYCYLNHKDDEFIIDLNKVWKWIGFSRIDPAKRVLEKNFSIDKEYKIALHRLVERKNEGGHNKENILMTIDTFKRLCMISNTYKAKSIRNYYIKMEKLVNETFEIQFNELQIQFEQKEKQNKYLEDNNKKLINDKKLEKQNILLKQFNKEINIVYIIRVKTFDDCRYIIKIGESRQGISNRFKQHNTNYEECLLLDCFEVDKSKQFEAFLHHELNDHKVTNLDGHEKENELFLVGEKLTYQMVENLINSKIKEYNDITKVSLELEQSKINTKNLEMLLDTTKQTNLLEFCKLLSDNQKVIDNKFMKLQNSLDEILNKVNMLSAKTTNNFNETLPYIGQRLQKINPETLKLITVYDTVTECIKENNDINRLNINNACKNNTIYHGYRWALVDRYLDPNILYDIQPTVEVKLQFLGYIAKLDINKTEILNVYLDRKSASILHGYSGSNFDTVVKNNKLHNGFYYVLYNDCNEELKDKFIEKYGKPILYKNGIGQYDLDNNLIQEFSNRNNCNKKLNICDRTLNKAIDSGKAYNGFYFKELPERLQFVNIDL